MDERNLLAAEFEASRPQLRALAYRMLGSSSEAEDAVQESWLRLNRSDTSAVDNLSGWLTTVTARVCLDMLRSRTARREEPLEARAAEPTAGGIDPEQEALLAESVGLALLVVLDRLAPAERLAFVLHDLFAVPFEEIAPIVGRSPTATRQLASRARRRVRLQSSDPAADPSRQREVVAAFLAASRAGDFAALLALLDPGVRLRSDAAAAKTGAPAEAFGPREVAGNFAGRAQAAQLAIIDGAPGLVWAPGGKPRVVFNFTIKGGKIAAIAIRADPEYLRDLPVEIIPTDTPG